VWPSAHGNGYAAPTLGIAAAKMAASQSFYTAMPDSPRRARSKRKPLRGALMRYQDRIAEVLGEARGQRVMIRSIHADGVERRTAVKWRNLVPLEEQLF
jgi:hypothetical protein